MNRNSYSSNYYNAQPSYKTVSSGLGVTGAPTRPPLYPIGPTLPQPQFKPIQRGTSPYVSRQGLLPPSYEQRHRHQTTTNFNQSSAAMGGRMDLTKLSYEDREKELIGRNQAEIEEEHKRREQIRLSYERQIASKSGNVSRNLERKQRLLAQLDALQATKADLHSKLMDLRPPDNKINTFQPIDRKQQEMIIMKNKLITQMREKEAELHKEQEQEQKFWENEVSQKQRILLKMQLETNAKRIELNSQKNSLEKTDMISLEDEVREQKYQDYLFQVSQIESKINRLVQDRQALTQDVTQNLAQKKLKTHNVRLQREDIARDREEIFQRVNDLQRIQKEMEEANSNLFNQMSRKESMITKYENDIQQLKDKKKIQQAMMSSQFQNAREGAERDLIPGLSRQISTLQEQLRTEQSITTALKTKYQRLYELLCSATTKNIHQTFGVIYSQDIPA